MNCPEQGDYIEVCPKELAELESTLRGLRAVNYYLKRRVRRLEKKYGHLKRFIEAEVICDGTYTPPSPEECPTYLLVDTSQPLGLMVFDECLDLMSVP